MVKESQLVGMVKAICPDAIRSVSSASNSWHIAAVNRRCAMVRARGYECYPDPDRIDAWSIELECGHRLTGVEDSQLADWYQCPECQDEAAR